MRRVALLVSLCVVVPALPAEAQIPFLDKLLANVSDVNVHGIFGSLQGDLEGLTAGDPGTTERSGLRGIGVEVSFDVGSIGSRPVAKKNRPSCVTDELMARLASADTTVSRKAVGEYKECFERASKPVVTPHPRERATVVDRDGKVVTVTTTDSLSIKPPEIGPDAPDPEPEPLINVELAVGFAQVSGVRSQSTSPDLRGSFQEFPSLAMYATYVPASPLSVYVGGRVGLVRLDGFRAYELDTTITQGDAVDSLPRSRIYTGSGSTYLLGGIAGLLLDMGDLSLFVERSYSRRRFGAVEWAASNTNEVARALPRSLKLDTWSWNVGMQISFKSD